MTLPAAVATIGILGAGRVETALARQALQAAYFVKIATAQPAEQIALLVDVLAPEAQPVTDAEAATADVVVLALPRHKYRTVDPALLAGATVVDAMTYWAPVEDNIAQFDTDPRTTSEIVQNHLAAARGGEDVQPHQLPGARGRRPGPGVPHRLALVVAGDDPGAQELVSSVTDRFGYDSRPTPGRVSAPRPPAHPPATASAPTTPAKEPVMATHPSRPPAATADPIASVPAEILTPRQVPLGGLRAMDVRRVLPQKQRSLIGPWCLMDRYGPDRVADTGGMQVPRHPHTGLATVSWLFTGKIAHRDSAGYEAIVRPGEVNVMLAGYGISHQEYSTPDTEILHGAQLWYALPKATRHMAPTFEHYAPEPVAGEGTELRVFLGSLAGSTSPVNAHATLLGAEALLEPGSRLELALDPGYEHGVLVDTGTLTLEGAPVATDHLAYLPTGRTSVVLDAGEHPVRVLILGGEPLREQIVMWWNFVGRTHEEVASYRAAWQAEIGAESTTSTADDALAEETPYPRFGTFPQGQPAPIPAPALPNVRLRPRG